MTIYNTFKEYIWLVNTIYQAKTISLAEINKRWVMTDMSEGIAFSRSTFYRHKAAIEDIFGINTAYSNRYIATANIFLWNSKYTVI